jgi:multicomponent Na+:H+ antiporter subunit D
MIVDLAFVLDPLAGIFAGTAAVLWLLVLSRKGARYGAFMGVTFLLTLGVATAGNLLTFLIFFELLSLAFWPLIVHDETEEALAAGRLYLVYILSGGSVLLLGVISAYATTGSVAFDAPVPPVVTGTLLAGLSVKAALIPVHGWVPRAHPVAPAPISALLSGLMVATGGLGMIRIAPELSLTPIAALTVVVAGVIAIRTDELKRRLAWSTISQMAYIPLALSVLHPEALAGGVVHITHHAFMKGGLFLCAGVIIHHAGVRHVSRMAGLGRRMPWTMGVFTLLSLGLVGIPPLSGFVTKWVMGMGMVEAGAFFSLGVLLLGALLAALYLMPIVHTAWFCEDAEAGADPPLPGLLPLVGAALLTVLLGVVPRLVDIARTVGG